MGIKNNTHKQAVAHSMWVLKIVPANLWYNSCMGIKISTRKQVVTHPMWVLKMTPSNHGKELWHGY